MSARSLFIRNARVLTMDPARPRAEAVLVFRGAIVTAGAESEVARAAREAEAEELDLEGRALVPAFIDAHMHFFGYAAKLVSVDCGPGAADSITAILRRIRARAAQLPDGAWVRASGYDELALRERRHPNRFDLDSAAPDHPVRLMHRSGHASVLNSRALAQAGISGETPEPPGGYMERDLETGEPTGLLVEMDEWLDEAVPPLGPAELRAAAAEASGKLMAAGITCLEDAGARNGPEEWRLVEELQAAGVLKQAVAMMEGYEHLGELPEGGGRLRRGSVKVMPRELEHEFHPQAGELANMLESIERAGRKAAVHAVSRRGVTTVLDAFERLGARAAGHRIEHCGVCSPADAARIARLGLTVVTQPGFLRQNGDLILKRLSASDLPDLYPLRRLLDAGVALAGSSDAPVIGPDAIGSMRAAVERRSSSGADMGVRQGIEAGEALALFTSSAARALGLAGERGRISPGLAADFVALDQDPTAPDCDWDRLAVQMTILGGEVTHRRQNASNQV